MHAAPESGFVSLLVRMLIATSTCICFEIKTKPLKQSFGKLKEFYTKIFLLHLFYSFYKRDLMNQIQD